MASIDTTKYLMPLIPPRELEDLGRELQTTIVELVNLSLIGKQLHWAVTGPLFRSLHRQLDELVDSWRDLADTVAERSVALGFVPDGQAQALVAGSQLDRVEQGPIEDHEAVRLLTHRLVDVGKGVRDQMNRLGETDLASQDVLIEVVRRLEKQQWMLRVQLGEDA
jgi:starvation-inducible DNA-binding protein